MINKGILCALIASVAWGLLYNIDQKLLLKINPLTMTLIVGVVEAVLIIPYLFTKNGSEDINILITDKKQMVLLLLAVLLYIIANVAILYSVKVLTAPVASVFEISYPFFVALFAFTLFKGELNLNIWIGGAMIFIGSVIVMK